MKGINCKFIHSIHSIQNMLNIQCNQRRIGNTLFIFLCLPFFSCSGDNSYDSPVNDDSTPSYQYTVPEEVEHDWQVGHAQDYGVDVELLTEFFNKKHQYLHSLLIIRHNHLLVEEYFPGQGIVAGDAENWERYNANFDRTTQHYVASVTKSFIATLIGICIDRGYISNIDAPLSGFFPEYADLFEDDLKHSITIAHALAMRSGIKWNGGTTSDLMIQQKEMPWVKYVLSQPMEDAPGEVMSYSDGLSVLLAEIVGRVTGQRADEFAQEALFDKIGISPPFWDISDWNEVGGGWGLWILPRDLAKLGQLYINKGFWEAGSEPYSVLSTDWVEKAYTITTPSAVPSLKINYNYHWWSRNYNIGGTVFKTLIASGAGNQHIFVIDDLDLVIAVTSGDYNGIETAPIDWVGSDILPAIQSD